MQSGDLFLGHLSWKTNDGSIKRKPDGMCHVSKEEPHMQLPSIYPFRISQTHKAGPKNFKIAQQN